MSEDWYDEEEWERKKLEKSLAVKKFRDMFPNQRKVFKDRGDDYEAYIIDWVKDMEPPKDKIPQDVLQAYLNIGYSKEFILAAWKFTIKRYPEIEVNPRTYILRDLVEGWMPL